MGKKSLDPMRERSETIKTLGRRVKSRVKNWGERAEKLPESTGKGGADNGE